MPEEHIHGDRIEVGNITHAQGTAIGRGASARTTGHNLAGTLPIDAETLSSVLGDLHQALGDADLGRDVRIGAQTAVGQALAGVGEDVDQETVLTHLRRAGDTLQQANVVAEQGTTLWNNITKLSALVGPIAGGARTVAGWFGISLP